MVPDKFNMVDMGGIDLIMMQGEAVPGLYDKLMAAISNCRYQCLYNWLFDGVLISPTYVQLTDIDGEVYLNEGVSVTSDDVIHIYSIEPAPVDPEIVPLLAEENGLYNVPAGVDGYNPVTVDVPTQAPVIEPITIAENGIYPITGSIDGYGPVTVNVPSPSPVIEPITIEENGIYPITGSIDGYGPITVNVSGGDVPEPSLPAAYQEVEYIDFDGNSYVTINDDPVQNNDVFELFAAYTKVYTSEQVMLAVSDPGSTNRFEIFFSNSQSRVYAASASSTDVCGRGAINSLYAPWNGTDIARASVSVGDKVYFMLELYKWVGPTKYLRIGAYGAGSKYKDRLYKIKRSRRIETGGDATTETFYTCKFEAFTWYKPCYRKADNVPGWYDTTNDVFYTNEGAGAFVVGPDVN